MQVKVIQGLGFKVLKGLRSLGVARLLGFWGQAGVFGTGTGELLTTLEALQELVSDGFVVVQKGLTPNP